MLLEEYYSYGDQEDYYYYATLAAFLTHPDLQTFDSLLQRFEEKEEYLICSGVKRAIDKIEDIHDVRFKEAAEETDTHEDPEGFYTFTADKHLETSKLIFQDIIEEIYDNQATRSKGSN